MKPLAADWFQRGQVAPDLIRITENHFDPIARANLWLLSGRGDATAALARPEQGFNVDAFFRELPYPGFSAADYRFRPCVVQRARRADRTRRPGRRRHAGPGAGHGRRRDRLDHRRPPAGGRGMSGIAAVVAPSVGAARRACRPMTWLSFDAPAHAAKARTAAEDGAPATAVPVASSRAGKAVSGFVASVPDA